MIDIDYYRLLLAIGLSINYVWKTAHSISPEETSSFGLPALPLVFLQSSRWQFFSSLRKTRKWPWECCVLFSNTVKSSWTLCISIPEIPARATLATKNLAQSSVLIQMNRSHITTFAVKKCLSISNRWERNWEKIWSRSLSRAFPPDNETAILKGYFLRA